MRAATQWGWVAFAVAGMLFLDQGLGRYRDGIVDGLVAKQLIASGLYWLAAFMWWRRSSTKL